MIRRFLLSTIFCLLAISLLSGCEESDKADTEFSIQQNLFLQSISLVEHAGSMLQNPEMTRADIDAAMLEMDKGLSQAFQVNDEFLVQLDPRLPKFYTRVFIPGVEQYRLGVESSDRQKQLDGLNKLSQWGHYWLQLKPDVFAKFKALNG